MTHRKQRKLKNGDNTFVASRPSVDCCCWTSVKSSQV